VADNQRERVYQEIEELLTTFQDGLDEELVGLQAEFMLGEEDYDPDVTLKLYSRAVEALFDFRRVEPNLLHVDVFIMHGSGETSDLDEEHFETSDVKRILVYFTKVAGYHQAPGKF